MPKFRLSAGSEIDVLNAAEARSLLREWMVDVAKGLRPITFNATGTTDGAGAIELGGAKTLAGGQLGPAPAFWWAVDRLAIRVDGVAAGAFSVFHGQASSLTLVRDVAATSGGFVSFNNRGLLLTGADSMVITIAGAAASKQVTVSGAAIEIPQSLLWRWLT